MLILMPRISVQHILIYSTELNDEAIGTINLRAEEQSLDKANALLDRARSGEDFTLWQRLIQYDVIEYTFGRGEGPEELAYI